MAEEEINFFIDQEAERMTEGTRKSKPTIYEIKITGHLEDRWTDWFAGLRFTHESDGTTTLTGPLSDQTALRGVLNHISDLGLSLISVQPINPDEKRSE
jgi:hypothetical protein